MKKPALGGFSTIDSFVADKLKRYSKLNKDFDTLFEFMFSERENVMFEKSVGFRIVKTTYGETRERILCRAAVLSKKLAGFKGGSAIGLHLVNSAEWIELFWAILACGFRPLLINTRLSASLIEQGISSVHAAAVIAADESIEFSVPTIPLSELEPGSEKYSPFCFGESIFVMSSGTSDRIKICEYSAAELYQTIVSSTEIIRTCPAIKKHYKGQLKLLAFLPFYHIFGFTAVYLWFGFFSRTFVLLNDYAPATIIDTIRRHEVTHIFAVPLFWNKVHDEAIREIKARGSATYEKFSKGMRLSVKLARVPFVSKLFRKAAFREVREKLFGESIRFMISGGSEISCGVLEFFNGIGYRLANGYGMTEIGITSVELSSDFRKLCSGSVGLPLASVEYSAGENGELLVRGSSLAKRIIEGGSVQTTEGWFHTADLAEFKNGRWYVSGRLDDIVISPAGENLNPRLIEAKLLVPGAREICLTSVREKGCIVPTLVVSLQPLLESEGVNRVYADIKTKLTETGLDGQIEKIVLVREPLIGSDDFKLNRAKTAKRLMNGEFTPADPGAEASPDESDMLTEHIRGLFAKALGTDAANISPQADFFLDAGGSSLDFFGIVSELQADYGITFPASSGKSLTSPAEIAEYIRSAVNGG